MNRTYMRFATRAARSPVIVLGAAWIPLIGASESHAGDLLVGGVEDAESFILELSHGPIDRNEIHQDTVMTFWPATFAITHFDGGDPLFGDLLVFDLFSVVHAIPPHGEGLGIPFQPLQPPNHIFAAGLFSPGLHTFLFNPVTLPHEGHVDLYAGELSFIVEGDGPFADFTSYSVLVTGLHTVPAPGAMAVMCLGLVVAGRRRRAV